MRLYEGVGGLKVLENASVSLEIGLPMEVREVQKDAFPVLRLGLVLLKPTEELQATLLQTVIGPHALLCSRDACKSEKIFTIESLVGSEIKEI